MKLQFFEKGLDDVVDEVLAEQRAYLDKKVRKLTCAGEIFRKQDVDARVTVARERPKRGGIQIIVSAKVKIPNYKKELIVKAVEKTFTEAADSFGEKLMHEAEKMAGKEKSKR